MHEGANTGWPEIGEIVLNHGQGRPEPTHDLDGETFSVKFDASSVAFTLTRGWLAWCAEGRVEQKLQATVFQIRHGIYFVDIERPGTDRSEVILLDVTHNRLLHITIQAPVPGAPAGLMARLDQLGSQSAVDVEYRHGALSGRQANPFLPSTELVGRQFRYRYSDTHLYDHFYLSARYYAWFCREGPDRGLGDFEECDHFQIAPSLILVCWREKLLPCVGVTIEDHQSMRSVGKIFGADTRTGTAVSVAVGAEITFIADIAGGCGAQGNLGSP